MSFQGQGFQGDGFQVGMPGLYPWAPATGTSYIEGLPDRVRTVFYQALAAVPAAPAATVTPITAGLQDIDNAFRGRFVAPQFQFSTFTQNDQRTATPITAGLQDFDLAFRRRSPPLPLDVIAAFPQVAAFETEGFDDFDQIIMRRPRTPPQDITFAIFTRPQAETEGFDDFDQSMPRRPSMLQLFSGFATISGVIASTPTTAGLRDFFDQPARPRQRLLQDITSAQFTPAQFETEGFDDFDQLSKRPVGKLLQDITFTVFTPTFLENEGWDDFDVLQPRPRRLPFWDITTSYPVLATVTPTTAGVEPTFGPLFKRPYLDHQYVTYPSNQTAVAVTPITAGLQDFDYRFRQPFRPPQFTDFVTISGIIASTPTTAGVQDFGLASFRRPRLQDFGASLISQVQAITAGLQDFDALLRRRVAQDQAQPGVAVPAAAGTAGTQGLDVPARQRPSLAQWQGGLVVTSQATVTPITAGLQDLDFRFVRPFRPALQQVTGYAPTVVSIAVTPGPFQFAIAGLPPFHYGMKASLQTFESRGQNVGLKLIVHRPAHTGLLTPQALSATKDAPTLAATKDQPGLSGTKDQPSLSGKDGETDVGGEVEG